MKFKPDFGSWETVELQPYQESHTVRNLRCGTTYGMTLAAVNEVGTGESSDVLEVSTDGGGRLLHCYFRVRNDVCKHQYFRCILLIRNGFFFLSKAPVAPLVNQLIEESANHATLHLESWVTNGCPILYFTVEYRGRNSDAWTLVTKGVKPNQRMQIIPDLSPGTWYTLRMTAHSAAGTTVAEYEFATLIDDKGVITVVWLNMLFLQTVNA